MHLRGGHTHRAGTERDAPMSYRTISECSGTPPWCCFQVWCLQKGRAGVSDSTTLRHFVSRDFGNCRKPWPQGCRVTIRTDDFACLRLINNLLSSSGDASALRGLEHIGDLRGGHGCRVSALPGMRDWNLPSRGSQFPKIKINRCASFQLGFFSDSFDPVYSRS